MKPTLRVFLLALALLGLDGFAVSAQAAALKGSKPYPILSTQHLRLLLKAHTPSRMRGLVYAVTDVVAGVASTAKSTTPSYDASATNVQVAGVDEADMLKVDAAGRAFQINGSRVRILQAYPPAAMTVLGEIDLGNENIQPHGLYVHDSRLVVLGTQWQPAETRLVMQDKIWWGGMGANRTVVRVYRLTDENPGKPLLERELWVDGDLIESRRIAGHLYVAARSYPNYYTLDQMGQDVRKARTTDLLPRYADSASGSRKTRTLPLSRSFYLPDFVEPDFVTLVALDINQPEKSANLNSYLGAGDMVYASPQNLYISASHWDYALPITGLRRMPGGTEQTTRIYKFALEQDKARFMAAGSVTGSVLNSFSMDEHDGNFRLATTVYGEFLGGQNRSQIHVLDADLKPRGRLDDLAPGEMIYAARFLGERCYLVTFRTVDPLFVIDLSNPDQPGVLGELKIPGYSNYLHPWDETHLIGFGKDVTTVAGEGVNADETFAGTSAYYQGLKLALFDVADVRHPREVSSMSLGDRGSSSPLLYDHKALYADQERGLIAFPAQLHRFLPGRPREPWEWGSFEWQGAEVFAVDVNSGFRKLAEISHLHDTSNPDGNSQEFIDRLFRIESTLFSLSAARLEAHDMADWTAQGALELETVLEKPSPKP